MKSSNLISLIFGVLEIGCFSWACHGFIFIQFVLENKKLFMTEKCTNEEISCNSKK